MSRKLDPRIGIEIIRLVEEKHPSLVSQEEFYTSLENNIDFDEVQLALHHQIAG